MQTVAFDSSPMVFIQRDQPAAPPAAANIQPWSGRGEYLYYCQDPAGFYPQVPLCSMGWLKVVPEGAPGRPAPIPQYQ